MAARPVWLAVGVLAAAGAAELGGSAAGSVAGGMAGGGVVAAGGMAAGLVGGAAVADRAGLRRGAALGAAALGAALIAARLALGLAAGEAGPGAEPRPAPLPNGAGTWRATVVETRTVSGQQLATLRVAEPQVTCAGQLAAYPRLTVGDSIHWTGRLRPLRDSDYDRWLESRGISARCDATAFTVAGHDTSPAGRLEELRQASGDGLQRVLPEPEGGLAAAILIGLRDRVDRDVAADFTTAGVSHIVAISGWNIAVVAATIGALLGSLARRRRAAITLGAIVAYTLFAGASPSVVRAAAMAGVALAAVESGRGSRAATGLAWAAAVMVLAEPATAGDAGFQLSAAATAGLVAWASPITQILEGRAPRLPAPIRESLGVSLAAQAATLPIVSADVWPAGADRAPRQPRGGAAGPAGHGRRRRGHGVRLAGECRRAGLADRAAGHARVGPAHRSGGRRRRRRLDPRRQRHAAVPGKRPRRCCCRRTALADAPRADRARPKRDAPRPAARPRGAIRPRSGES